MIGYISQEATRSLSESGMNGQLALVTPDITRELGQLSEVEISRLYAGSTEVVPLGETVVLGIPLSTWMAVAAGATMGAAGGAYLMSERPVAGAAVGGLFGSLVGVGLVAMLGRPKTPEMVMVPNEPSMMAGAR